MIIKTIKFLFESTIISFTVNRLITITLMSFKITSFTTQKQFTLSTSIETNTPSTIQIACNTTS